MASECSVYFKLFIISWGLMVITTEVSWHHPTTVNSTEKLQRTMTSLHKEQQQKIRSPQQL